MPRRLLLALFLAACTSEGADQDGPDTDTDPGEPACATYERAPRGEPGPLQAGVARARIPAPLGIGTAGNGPFGASAYPTPFAEIYPGTRRIHGHPEIKVVALSRGPGHEAFFVRLDAVGVFEQLRNDVVARASERLGRPLDDAILLGATHTHSGPGRVVNTGSTGTNFFSLIADKFHPEFYDRFVGAVVDALVAAHDDLAPARVGFGDAVCHDGHADRRCEDGEDYENGALPVIAVERGGQVDAVIMAYAVHGTVFGIDEGFLSQDVHGAMEEAVEDRFDHPVEALVFTSWAADMSPGNPQGVPHDHEAADLDGGFDRVRHVGWTIANAVDEVLADLAYVDDPELHLETHRFPIDREAIGYTDDEFPYAFGGVYCSGGGCEPPAVPDPDLLKGCVPFTKDFPAPDQTSVTVGRVGDFALVTFPGEPGTRLAEALMDEVAAAHDADRFLFLGYTQDYLGYSILEEDWWFGGYEASGALWGPRQGAYLVDRITDAYGLFAEQACPAEAQPEALQPFPYTIDAPYVPETALDANTVGQDVPDVVFGPGDVVEVTVHGQDPWLGAPLAWLEDADGAPLRRPNGVVVDSDDYNFDVALTVDPSYKDQPRGDRRFAWRFRIPVRQPVGGVAIPDGTWTLKVAVPQPDGGEVVVESSPFAVSEAP